MDRRSFIGFGTLAAGALMGGRFSSAFAESTNAKPGETVDTNLGKVRGTVRNGVHAFKGVPYAASTAGENRFMPPKKRQPWTGIRDALELGLRSPQLWSAFHGQVPPEFEPMDRNEPMGEDCEIIYLTQGAHIC